MKPTLTIVICSYKYGHLASHAIESVLSQTVKPDHIRFVDDGVGDCNHLPTLYPEVDFLMREKNLGTVDNFQDMLRRVKTDYVMFLGADNWLRPDTVEILKECMVQHPNDIIMYDILVTGELAKQWLTNHSIPHTQHEGGYIWKRDDGHHGSMCYNVSKAKEVGGYNEGYGKVTLEDQALFNRMKANDSLVTHIHEPLLFYRRHRENHNKIK